MRKQLTHFSLHQTSKVIAILYFFIALVIVIPFSIFAFFQSHDPLSFAMLLAPVAYLVITYIITIILLWFYNLVAKGFGGVEFELSDTGEE